MVLPPSAPVRPAPVPDGTGPRELRGRARAAGAGGPAERRGNNGRRHRGSSHMKQGFDLHDRSSARRIFRFVLLAVIIGFGVNIVLSLLMDRSQILHSLSRVRVIYFVVPLLLF